MVNPNLLAEATLVGQIERRMKKLVNQAIDRTIASENSLTITTRKDVTYYFPISGKDFKEDEIFKVTFWEEGMIFEKGQYLIFLRYNDVASVKLNSYEI